MVQVNKLKKYFYARKSKLFAKAGTIKALDDISFSIPQGKTLGMVGESGSGKSTAARSILRLIEPDEGEIYIDDKPVHSMAKEEFRQFRKNMQIVFQDPYGSLNPRINVGRIISEPLRIHTKMKSGEVQERLAELMDIVGLQQEHVNRYPHEFSGGQRQRIGIARALALNPKFMILDEPVSALDVSIQGQILNLLMELQKKLGLTYLFIAHDLAVVEHMSDRIVVMYLGRIVEESSTRDLYKRPLHPYTKSLMNSIPEPKPKKQGFKVLPGEIPSPLNPPEGCHFHPRCPKVMDACRVSYPPVCNVGNSRVSCFLYK